MVTKSLLDKILSKTVKHKELNALSVSKEDRDRIYNNIINGDGSGSGSSNKVDLFDLVDVVGVNVFYRDHSSYLAYCIPYSGGNYTEDEVAFKYTGLFLCTSFNSLSLYENYAQYSFVNFDFNNNEISINKDMLDLLKTMTISEYNTSYNPASLSPCRALLLIKKNLRYTEDSTNVHIDINISDKLNELKNMNGRKMILNPKMSNEMKTAIINSLTS